VDFEAEEKELLLSVQIARLLMSNLCSSVPFARVCTHNDD